MPDKKPFTSQRVRPLDERRYVGPRYLKDAPATSGGRPAKFATGNANRAGGGPMGGSSYLASGLTDATKMVSVDRASVWGGHQGYDLDRRPLQCVRCDHVFKRRGDLIEDMGDLICKGRVSCRKRQQGENV